MILAIDIGTTVLKAALVSKEGRVEAIAKRQLSIDSEMCTDALAWIDAIASASNEIASQAGKDAAKAIVVDANGPTLIAYPDTRARLWLDRSASIDSIKASEAAGFGLDSSFMIPKILKLRRTEPETFLRTKWFFGAQDYVNYILTGVSATLMPLEGLEKWYWNDAMLDRLSLARPLFPAFIRMGSIIGSLRPEMAQRMGLGSSVPVIAGCPDFASSIIGSGTMKSGMICDRSGTSEGINLCSGTPSSDPHLMCYRHPDGKDWNISGIISTTGKAISKTMSLLGFKDDDYEGFYELARHSSAGSGGVIFQPYLAGERAPIWDSSARASFFGMTASTGRCDIARSACEGICLAIADVLDAMKAPRNQMRITGGPSENSFLNQLKADVCQIPITAIDSPEPELLGLAIIGYTGLGVFPTLSEGAAALVKTGRTYEPRRTLAGLYHDALETYRKLYRVQQKSSPAT
jgi:xylulokinase